MTPEQENEVLKAIVNALLARSEGVLIVSRREIEASFNNAFKYEMTSDSMLIERV